MQNNKIYVNDIQTYIDDILEMEYGIVEAGWEIGVDPVEGAYIHLYDWEDVKQDGMQIVGTIIDDQTYQAQLDAADQFVNELMNCETEEEVDNSWFITFFAGPDGQVNVITEGQVKL